LEKLSKKSLNGVCSVETAGIARRNNPTLLPFYEKALFVKPTVLPSFR
jgi:hypothetical protein